MASSGPQVQLDGTEVDHGVSVPDLHRTAYVICLQMSGLSKVLGEQEGALRVMHKVLLQPAGAQPAGSHPALEDLRRFHQGAETTLTAVRVRQLHKLCGPVFDQMLAFQHHGLADVPKHPGPPGERRERTPR